jgi:hypothetical protein
MSLGDTIAILGFLVTILGTAYAFGKQAQRLGGLEEDLDGLGKKVDAGLAKSEKAIASLDRRLDRTNEFRVRADQRVADLERRVYGDAITEMMRSGMPFNPTGDDDTVPM